MSNRKPKRRGILAAGLAVAILVALIGCGGSEAGGNFNVGKLPHQVAGAPVSWGQPSGKPTGVVMLLPGGGWQRSASGYEQQKSSAKYFQDKGYATVAVEYDSGVKGFKQVVKTYRTAQKHFAGVPICATGISAGGHWALMLAAREPQLRCVVALSSPTDLTTVAAQDASGDEVYGIAVATFGQGGLARWSPVNVAGKISAKVLLMAAESDPIVPAEQSREFAAAHPGTQLLIVPAGSTPAEWAHFGGVDPEAQNTVIQREFDFLQQALK